MGIKIFFVLLQFFCVFLPPLLYIFCFCQVHTVFVLSCAHLCMECSLGISNFPEEICQFRSFAQLCLTLCNPMDCSTPGLLVHHQLPEPTQTHVHCVGDAVQPSHPLSFPSPPALNFSQYQGLQSFHSIVFLYFFCISITTNNLFHSLNTEFKKCQGFNVRVSSLLYIYKILCEVGRFIFPLKPPLPFSVWHTYSRISVTISKLESQ